MTPTDSKKKTKGTGSAKTRGAASKAEANRICPACRADNNADSRFCSRCAAPLLGTASAPDGGGATVRASTVELARGNRLAGRYEILEELGRGGMGRVFKTHDHKINEVIALKLIRPEIGVQEKAIERFKNELKFTRKITHRNICRMYDLGEEDFVYYITMEYVAGEDLKRFVKRAGPLNAGKAVMIAEQICDGLSEAHRIGAVHRDLKPQNIMIDHDGNAKIMDFGIARFTDMDRMTGSGVMIGTPEYMSPEQAEVKEVDARSDIYSLGVVLFEMVTGKVPFEGETTLSLALKHKTEIPKNVRELNALITPGLASVIAKCLEKDPSKRYQSAAELKTALESADRDLPTAEREFRQKPAPPAAAASAGPGKKPIPLIAAAVVVVAAVASYFLFLKPGPAPEVSPGAPTENRTAAVTPDAGLSPASGGASQQAVSEKTQAVPEKKAAVSDKKTAAPEKKPAETAKKEQGSLAGAPPAAGPKAADVSPADRQAMDVAKARMTGARGLAEQKGLADKSEFFHAGDLLREEAAAATAGNKMAEARCLFTIAEKLFRLCVDESSDLARWRALGKLIDTLRQSALEASGGVPLDPLFQDAQNLIGRGEAAFAKDDFKTAVRHSAAAAVNYEKIKWAAQSAKKK